MLMSERWKEIKGYRETYMVSDHGNVKTKTRPGARGTIVQGHALTKTENSNGYMRVSMRLADDSNTTSTMDDELYFGIFCALLLMLLPIIF